MTTFHKQFRPSHVCLDDRTGIGPHHLSIGKTRKLFETGGNIDAFYSTGYDIGHARLDAESLELRTQSTLSEIPAAFGGGGFCVDADGNGRATLVFVHRNRREFCFVQGEAKDGGFAWGPWQPLLATKAHQAAPWVETGPDGTAWCSVLARDGDFRLATIAPDGTIASAPLFEPDEAPWYHSCVQVLPVGEDDAVAIGFRGTFPAHTELVFKTVRRNLSRGPARTLAPCNVNDQFTFHFQAVGDPARGRAHIAYLDEGLSVSHAVYERGEWLVQKGIVPFACFAPQITLNDAGCIALLACDYEGGIWTASWSRKTGWSRPRRVDGLPPCTISGLFGRTGFGTGGLISAARSTSERVPFLIGAITDERTGQAKLHAGALGRQGGRLLHGEGAIEITAKDGTLSGKIRLASLKQSDLARPGLRWAVGLPRQSGAPMKVTIAFANGQAGAKLATCGSPEARELSVDVQVRCETPFTQQRGFAEIAFRATLANAAEIVTDGAWVETYDGGTLVDLAPFEAEVTARTAQAPARIPALYKRLI